MKAVVFHDVGDVRLGDIEEPKILLSTMVESTTFALQSDNVVSTLWIKIPSPGILPLTRLS